jgi:hypothetical protein
MESDQDQVWRLFHVHFTRKEDYSIPREERQRLHSQWQAEGCQRGGNLYRFNHTGLWRRRGL